MLETVKHYATGIEESFNDAKEKVIGLVPADKKDEANQELNIVSAKLKDFKSFLTTSPEVKTAMSADIAKKMERWSDLSIDQLSFFNNLLIVLGCGFLGFAFKDYGIGKLKFASSLNAVETVPTLSFLALLFMTASVFLGLLCGFNRLLVFNHSAQVMRLKQEFLTRDISLEGANAESVKNPLRFWLIKPKFYNPQPTDWVSNIPAAKQALHRLSKLCDRLRDITSILLKFQIVIFLLAIVCFVSLLALK